MAPNPDRLICEHKDILSHDYPDHFFDITICTSVIEHIWPKDIHAMSEIVRVTKPGGTIALSTGMSEANQRIGGAFYYNLTTFMERLIDPYPVSIRGPYDFSLASSSLDAVDIKKDANHRNWPCTPVYTL